ncbi:hypothetical protein BOX15_Mlig010612g1 [Macrostomum lignano]|uniref:C2H2-type domain-containing protein n=1 Tax=Macrostomum lignano TaxID=282301 RepID=A0A267GA34_9PLAT|nr:hypothetical protein BOX15_Mlig010612g1 [Macrostomum lignano]
MQQQCKQSKAACRAGFKKYLRDRYLSDLALAASENVETESTRRQSSSSSSQSPPPLVSPQNYSTSAGSQGAPLTPLQLLLLQQPQPQQQQQVPVTIECRFVFPPVEEPQRSGCGGNSQYVCSVCGRSFTRGDMLSRHARLHSGRRPYGCPVCGLAFSRSDHLTTHRRTHTGEKPYACPHCSYSACRKDMINRHMKVHSASPAAASKAPPAVSGVADLSIFT